MDNQKIAVFYCYNSSWNLAEDEIERRVALASDVAKEVTNWRRVVYLTKDVEIEDPLVDVLVDPDSTDHPNYSGIAILNYRQDNPDAWWTHYHLIGGFTTDGYAGYGKKGMSVVFNLWSDEGLHNHEVNGHGLNIGHMGSILRPGVVNDYGGYGVGTPSGRLPDNNAYRYTRLIERNRIIEIDSGRAVLFPIESDDREVGGHHQLLKLVDSETNEYYIALRRYAGAYSVGTRNTIQVDARYRKPIQKKKTKTIDLGRLRLGESMEVGDHLITYESNLDERAVVKVVPKGQPDMSVPPINVGDKFNLSSTEPLEELDTGLYYHPVFEGQGYDVFIKGDRCAVGWYFYDRGDQEWYTMEGDIADGVARLDVFKSDPSGSTKVGEAVLEKVNGELYMQWVTEDQGRASLRLTKLGGDPRGELTGWYHNPDIPKEGLKIIQLGGRATAYYFGYEGGKRKWWMYDLTQNEDGSFTGTEYTTRGGDYLSPQDYELLTDSEECDLYLEGNVLFLRTEDKLRELYKLF